MDVTSYRRAEALGKSSLRDWRLPYAHMPPTFVDHGFPVRIESVDDLLLILDTMQEDRFDMFVQELRGLSNEEVQELITAMTQFVGFYLAHFPGEEVQIPLSTFIGQLAIAIKIRQLPNRKSVLEVGPGCGYISYFIRNDAAIERYHTVETTESFYLLQSMLNASIFGATYRNHARIDGRGTGIGNLGALEGREANAKHFWAFEDYYALDIERTPRMEMFPWWKLGEVMDNSYDLIMMNANLTEFSHGAFLHYLNITMKTLAPEGYVFCQCQGGGELELSMILNTMFEEGLYPVAMLPGSMRKLEEDRQFVVSNFLFVRRTHSSIPEKPSLEHSIPKIDTSDPLSRAVFGFDRQPQHMVPRLQALNLVASGVKALYGFEASPITSAGG